jgi:tRNA modification GTPase
LICGKPNTGKSTLLNLLCREDRAIVTDKAGTTRDIITESVICGNVTLNISDTAGIRNTLDEIESEGVRRSIVQMEKSDLLICVFESVSFDENDKLILKKAKEMQSKGAVVLIVINKTDLNPNPDTNKFKDFKNIIKISTKNDSHYGTICEEINRLYMCEQLSDISYPVLTNLRQKTNAEKALDFAKSAFKALDESSIDVAGTELEGVMTSLGELDGRQVGIEIVDDIFSRFCVGK